MYIGKKILQQIVIIIFCRLTKMINDTCVSAWTMKVLVSFRSCLAQALPELESHVDSITAKITRKLLVRIALMLDCMLENKLVKL